MTVISHLSSLSNTFWNFVLWIHASWLNSLIYKFMILNEGLAIVHLPSINHMPPALRRICTLWSYFVGTVTVTVFYLMATFNGSGFIMPRCTWDDLILGNSLRYLPEEEDRAMFRLPWGCLCRFFLFLLLFFFFWSSGAFCVLPSGLGTNVGLTS